MSVYSLFYFYSLASHSHIVLSTIYTLMKNKLLSLDQICVKDKTYIPFAQLTFLFHFSKDLNFIITKFFILFLCHNFLKHLNKSIHSLYLGHSNLTEKAVVTHSSIFAWRIPGTEEPGGLPSMGSHRIGHDWSDLAAANLWKGWV